MRLLLDVHIVSCRCVSEMAVINVMISATERDNASETSSIQDSDSVADDTSVTSASEHSAASTSAPSNNSGMTAAKMEALAAPLVLS